MENTRKEFTEVIHKQYQEHCKLNEIEPSIEGFAVYIVNRNLVTDLTINRFLVIDLYPHILAKNMGIKNVTLWDIEGRVGVKYSTIRTYLDRFQLAFRLKNRVTCKT